MRREGGTIRFIHFIRIAVIRRDEHCAAHLRHRVNNAAHAGVHSFHRLDGGFKYAGVADHIAVGKV